MGLFGPPKITLMLEKYNFNPGEKAKGTITLNLKKPTYARKLQISLIGTRKVRRGNSTEWQKVYDFDMPISGEKEYQKDTIQFELPISPDILSAKTQQEAMQNALEDKLGAAGSFIGAIAVGRGTTKWKIRAQLDVPKALDVKADQDIQLYPAENMSGGNI
jgi:hypothetical protein